MQDFETEPFFQAYWTKPRIDVVIPNSYQAKNISYLFSLCKTNLFSFELKWDKWSLFYRFSLIAEFPMNEEKMRSRYINCLKESLAESLFSFTHSWTPVIGVGLNQGMITIENKEMSFEGTLEGTQLEVENFLGHLRTIWEISFKEYFLPQLALFKAKPVFDLLKISELDSQSEFQSLPPEIVSTIMQFGLQLTQQEIIDQYTQL